MGLPVRVVPLVVDGSSSGVRGALAPLGVPIALPPTLPASLLLRLYAGVGGHTSGCRLPQACGLRFCRVYILSLGDGSGSVGSVGLPSLPQRVSGSGQI